MVHRDPANACVREKLHDFRVATRATVHRERDRCAANIGETDWIRPFNAHLRKTSGGLWQAFALDDRTSRL